MLSYSQAAKICTPENPETNTWKILKLFADQAVQQNGQILTLKSQLVERDFKISNLEAKIRSQEGALEKLISANQRIFDENQQKMTEITCRLTTQMERLNRRKSEIEGEFQRFSKILAEKDSEINALKRSEAKMVQSFSAIFLEMNKCEDRSKICDAQFRNRHLIRSEKADKIIFESNTDPLLTAFSTIAGKAFSERIGQLWQSGFHGKTLASTASLVVGNFIFDFDAELPGHIRLNVKKLEEKNLEWLNGKIIHFNRGNRTKRTVSA